MNPDEFRADLMRRLAMEPFLGLADRNGVPPDLASKLGVTPEIIDGAIQIVRGGASPVGPSIVHVDVFLPALLRPAYLGACEMHRLGTAQLLRSLLHAVLLTYAEPSPRARGKWAPAAGCDAARARLEGLGRALVSRQTAQHLTASVSTGLFEALQLRALAHRVPVTQYVVRWVADLLDGRVESSAIIPVEVAQTFTSSKSYVLPVLL